MGSIPVWVTNKKVSFVYRTKETFFDLSVPCGTISTPMVREAMLHSGIAAASLGKAILH